MAVTIPSRRAKFTSTGWRIALTVLGVLLICYGLFNTLFKFIGTEVTADVTSVQMQGKYNDKTLGGGTGTVEVGYTFTLPNQETIAGKSTFGTKVDYSNPDNVAALKTISVYYLSFWPQINRAAPLVGFQLDTLAFPVVGALLIILINVRAIRYKARQAKQQLPS
ncbi:MAG: hypothetical protein IIY71_04980 [Oscillospiraceae bacterium]|nr:hypothetical protein [Oscillospiraceae bacterium]